LLGIGFGTWAWGNQILWGYDSNQDDKILEDTFNKAIKGGLSLVDTADSYGTGILNGRSETLLGEFIEKLPSKQIQKINITTKLAPYPWRLGRKGFQKAFEASKRRLKGHLDRVQLHWSTSRYFPWQEEALIENLGDLIESERIQEIGVSNLGPERLLYIHNTLKKRGIKLKSLQVQLSLLSPQRVTYFNANIGKICKELNIDIIAYSPLSLGILSVPPGYKNKNKRITFLRNRIFNEILPASIDLRKLMEEIAKGNNASQSQVALNWCRANGAIPIPGLRNPSHAEDAIKALSWNLSKKEKAKLDELSENCKIRMPNNPFQSK
tara:strand:- start:136 stop:1107 length:972 start_codon:yes stop_codon:yes gene_type:complete